MFAAVLTGTLHGLDALPVTVEVDDAPGLPALELVGLPAAAVRESKVRVKAALASCGFPLPHRRFLVNLVPGDLRKTGSSFDLAIAAALLLVTQRGASKLDRTLVVGELSISGEVLPVRGVLAQLRSAQQRGVREAIVPAANQLEAALAPQIDVRLAAHLSELASYLQGSAALPGVRECAREGKASAEQTPADPSECSMGKDRQGSAMISLRTMDQRIRFGSFGVRDQPEPEVELDLANVRGQAGAKRALEIAAAGQHHLLFVGPPGAGKSMLARRLVGIMPPLTGGEALDVATIAGAAGAPCRPGEPERPFRAPHHSASPAAIVGGGDPVGPGEVTLAHGGILFLDELPEFRRDVIEALRTTMETGEVTVSRARQRVTMPAAALVVAAMNPCPCGFYGDAGRICRCPPEQVHRYLGRVSGPLVDRFDLHVQVPRVSGHQLQGVPDGETSDDVRNRVWKARCFAEARRREGSTRIAGNAVAFLCRAIDALGLSARAFGKVMKLSRTIADLAAEDEVKRNHIAEALQFRRFDRHRSEAQTPLEFRSIQSLA